MQAFANDRSPRLEPMDEEPRSKGDIEFQRFICVAGKSRIVLCLMNRTRAPEPLMVHVSPDFRRIPLFWRLPGDFRLVRRVASILEQAGGKIVTDDE